MARLTWTGATGHQVESILRRYHIHASSRRTSVHAGVREFSACVPDAQAAWAEYVLLRGGVPLIGAAIDPENRRRTAAHSTLPTPWGQRKHTSNIIEWLSDIVAGLIGQGEHHARR